MKNIFVGNLDYGTTQEDLTALFQDFGAVERVNLIKDRETGQSRGFAFVEMTNDEEADNAIASLNGAQVGRRKIRVNEARPQEGGPRGGGGGRPSFGGGGGPRRDGPGGGYNREPRGPQAPASRPGGSPQWWDE